MSLTGNIGSLKAFSKALREIPSQTTRNKVAAVAAPAITDEAQTTFHAGQNPYGRAWAPGIDGQRITLVDSGDMMRTLRYTSIGTRIRVVLGVKYAKYQIGKRQVFPRQGGALPTSYVNALTKASDDVLGSIMKAGGAS